MTDGGMFPGVAVVTGAAGRGTFHFLQIYIGKQTDSCFQELVLPLQKHLLEMAACGLPLPI
jgi:hypothetical protein